MNTQQAALNPLVSSRKCLTRTYGGKTTFTHTIAANKRANSHNFKIKKNLNFLTVILSLPFTYWTRVNLRILINRRWEWIIISVRSWTVFLENIVVTVLANLAPLFFQKCACACFSYALSNWSVSDCNRYSYTFKVCLEAFQITFIITQMKIFR